MNRELVDEARQVCRLVSRFATRALVAFVALLAGGVLNLGGSTAEAAPSDLWTKCNAADPAIQCTRPRGVAANPGNGRVFVGDQGNNRVVELNARGEFIKAWGWDVVQGGGTGFEICVAENGDVCKAGSGGGGAGQFGPIESPQGVAVDSVGNVYVVDPGLPSNRRVQKFASTGQFLRMWGKGVNTGTSGNAGICTNAGPPTDVCGAGGSGSGNGEFSWSEELVASFIAIDRNGTPTDADDTVYVGDVGRIQEFDTDGNYIGQIALPGVTVGGIASDSAGSLYVIYRNKADVRKLTAAGEELAAPRFKVADPTAVAVDPAGNVYAFRPPLVAGSSRHPILKFDSAGNLLEEFGMGEFDGSTGLATNLCPGSEAPGNLYVTNASIPNAFVRAYGTDPVGCFKARTLPANPVAETNATLNGSVNPKGEAVTECFFRWGETTAYGQTAPCVPGAGAIGTGSEPVPVHADLTGLQRGTVYHFRLIARVGGEVEPGSDLVFKTLGPPVISDEHVVGATDTEATLRGFANPEGFATSCHFEYGTTAAYGQSTPAEAIGSDRSDHLLSVTLKGLTPGTTYHWRIVCTNSSDTTAGGDHTFATSELPALDPACSNQAFRTGASAFLPDCRAYEMVSPIDKNGGNVLLLNEGIVQTTPEGDRLTYNTISSFGDAQNSWSTNQYLASRTERGEPGEGWSNHGIHPPVLGESIVSSLSTLGIVEDFLGFTPDLCSAWIFDYIEPSLTSDGQKGYADFYRRDNCGPGEGGLEALVPEPPPLPQNTMELYVDLNLLRVQGISEDGRHAVFVAKAPLLQDCRTVSAAKAVSYQWLRDGVPIAGATSAVYAATAADMGAALQCQVFAINDNAGSTQVANPPSIIPPKAGVTITPPTAPPLIAQPAQSGALTVGGPGGQTLTCNPGSWEGLPTFTYQWYRNGVAISGATASTYIVSAADVASAAVFQCGVRGANEDGAVTKVSANRATSPLPSPLPPAANANVGGEVSRIYDRFGGELHQVSILPDGKAARTGSQVQVVGGRAVSADGSRVYWITGPQLSETGRGQIYLRQHPEQGIVSGECSDAAKACTVPVSTSDGASFWAAARDGSKAIYSEGALSTAAGELFEFDLNEEGGPRSVAKQVEEFIGASDDLSHVYFVSRGKLTGSEQNSEDDEAIEGAPNLYLDEGGTLHYVATLGGGDVRPGQLGIIGRVSADGSRIAFQSRASLTDYDNTDAANGKADVEVFAYEAGKELRCISCNPSGARPRGRELAKPFWSMSPEGHGVFAAAWIPASEQPLHASNVLSADGNRIFFNSNDALLPRDTNGTMDVYQWQAPGKGSCDTEDPSYFPQNGGCLDLISTGESPFESEFWEASADGDDVFFTTESSLVPSDPGLVDLYDARVGGGFPQPIADVPCEGEACQSPPPPPALPTPASRTYEGPGNVNQVTKSCPKGKRKVRKAGKVHCVKKRKGQSKGQKGKAKRRAADNRRAPR